MPISGLDHIVLSVTNIKKSTVFYSAFLGKGRVSLEDVSWSIGVTKLFLTVPYKKSARRFDKHNIGLNHIAFGVSSVAELKKYASKLTRAKIVHSGIQTDPYGKKPFIWFDDPDGIRLELYLR